MGFRIGFGYDLHRLTDDRPLILGGIQIPYEKGLEGHSDADVLLHAITDAMLGALALGDIGKFYPDTDPGNKNIDSKVILADIDNIVKKKGYIIVNVDTTVIAEVPKLLPYILEIRKSISRILKIDTEKISVKATTNEGMGYLGEKKAIAVHAVVLLTGNEGD